MERYQETWRETASGVGRGWRPFSGQFCSWWSHCVCVELEGGVKKSTQKQRNPEHRVPTVLGHRNTAGSKQQAASLGKAQGPGCGGGGPRVLEALGRRHDRGLGEMAQCTRRRSCPNERSKKRPKSTEEEASWQGKRDDQRTEKWPKARKRGGALKFPHKRVMMQNQPRKRRGKEEMLREGKTSLREGLQWAVRGGTGPRKRVKREPAGLGGHGRRSGRGPLKRGPRQGNKAERCLEESYS